MCLKSKQMQKNAYTVDNLNLGLAFCLVSFELKRTKAEVDFEPYQIVPRSDSKL